jgi:hypothetical protein
MRASRPARLPQRKKTWIFGAHRIRLEARLEATDWLRQSVNWGFDARTGEFKDMVRSGTSDHAQDGIH